MSDNTKAERRSAAAEGREASRSPLANDPFQFPSGQRLDRPHTIGPPSETLLRQAAAESRQAGTTTQQAIQDETLREADSAIPAKDATAARPEADLLLQASQIAEHLRAQFAELDRREQGLNAQLHELDQERRNVRLWVRQFEEEVVECEGRLRTREAEAAQKMVSCERLAAELARQQQNLIATRDSLEAERAALRDEIEQELADQFAAVRQAQETLEAERGRLDAEREEIKTERAKFDEELLTARRDFDPGALERDRQEWIAARDAALAEIQREREINDVALTRAQEELAALRRQQREELDKQKHQQEQRLLEERQEFERERDTQLLRLQQDRAVLEKRVRFQQEHLQKSRHEFEDALASFRRERQQARTDLEQRESVLRLRAAQLQRFREILAEREACVEREQSLISKLRRAQEAEIERDRDEFRRDRDSWEQERQAQRAELRRQQDMLAAHAENLEARRVRLDQLRSELEETHRTTLEMRLSIEEVWGHVSQSIGAETAKRQVDEAREALSEHYRHLREALTQQRREMDAAQTLFQQQKDEFREERKTLAEWVAARDEQLRQWDEQVRQAAAALDEREAAWRAARDRWMHEKIEAEEIIRSLLAQVTELNDPDSGETENP